jgi:hypothetical protein
MGNLKMSNEVKLIQKQNKDGEISAITKTFVIDDISFFQFGRLLKVLDKTFEELKKDDSMTEFIENVFGEDVDIQNTEDAIAEMDSDFLVKAMGAFNFIAVKLPDRAIELVSVLSGIEKELLEQQKLAKVLDVYDAVIEANDIEALITRLKKSWGATKAAMKYLNLRQKATQQ